jgi:glycosyltransferase involved in cell wall biosynthesis
LRVGFLCQHDLDDKTSFSGAGYFAYRSLAKLLKQTPTRVLHHGSSGIRQKISKKLGFTVPKESRFITRDLDVIIGFVSSSLIPALSEQTATAIIHVTDATPLFLREAYGWNISEETMKNETKSINAATKVVYSSKYMADRAIEEYGTSVSTKVSNINFGLNISSLPRRASSFNAWPPLRLLFVGSDWKRKGGEIAMEACEILRRRGNEVHIDLVGVVPESIERNNLTTAHGYLNKNKWLHARRLEALFRSAHLLISPTRADCTPMIVAEANAFGLPVLITDTGGVPSLMSEGKNGRMMSIDATPSEWADAIFDLTIGSTAYSALRADSFEHAQASLTWEVWARKIMQTAASLR